MGLLMSKTIPQISRLQVSVPHCLQDLYARAQLLQKKNTFKRTLDSFPVILTGRRANENNVNDSIYCREET